MKRNSTRLDRSLTRRRILLVIALVLLVVVPRITAAMAISEDYFDRGDLNWDRLARKFIAGEGFGLPSVGAMYQPMVAHRPPVFPMLLTGLYVTVGRSPATVVVLQILLSLLATWAVWRLGVRMTGSRTVGFLAAAVVALYPPLAFHDVQMSDMTLFRALTALLTLELLRAGTSPKRGVLVRVALFAGLAVLTRTSIVLFLPLAAIWLLILWRGRLRVLLLRIALAVGVFLLVLSPWLAHNAVRLGRVHLITGGGRSLWMGWNDAVLEFYPEHSIDHAERRAWKRIPLEERRKLCTLGEIEFDAAMKEIALDTLSRDPGRIPALAARKLGAAFSPRLNPRITGDSLDESIGGTKRLIYTLSYGPLLLLGACGLVLLAFRRRAAFTLLLFHLLAFAAATVLYWAHSRHRYYLDPFLAVTAAAFCVWIVQRLRRGDAAEVEPVD